MSKRIRGVTQISYADIVIGLAPAIKGGAWITEKKRNVRLTDQDMKDSMGFSREQEVVVKEKHKEGMSAVLKASGGTYIGKDGDGGSLCSRGKVQSIFPFWMNYSK